MYIKKINFFSKKKRDTHIFSRIKLIGGDKVRYPLVKQEGLKDCGPCSLAMIIKYYGGNVSTYYLEDLIK